MKRSLGSYSDERFKVITRTPEQVIVEALLDALNDGKLGCLKHQESEIRAIGEELKTSSGGSSDRLKELLSETKQISEAVVNEITQITLDFVSREIEKYTNIRAVRELTDEEKQYGRNTLPRLLSSLRSLVGVDLIEPNGDDVAQVE